MITFLPEIFFMGYKSYMKNARNGKSALKTAEFTKFEASGIKE